MTMNIRQLPSCLHMCNGSNPAPHRNHERQTAAGTMMPLVLAKYSQAGGNPSYLSLLMPQQMYAQGAISIHAE